MARTKATVRRIPLAVIPQRIGNKNILNRRLRNMSFRLIQILPEMKKVAVKKTGQVIRQMNVRRKATYFSGKRRLDFQFSLIKKTIATEFLIRTGRNCGICFVIKMKTIEFLI